MAIRTALTEAFGLAYPIVLAPMGQVAGGQLAAAVSNAGGLGLVGGGEPRHVRADLGDENLRSPLPDTRDGVQPRHRRG
jgi:nitronate monooxygenase